MNEFKIYILHLIDCALNERTPNTPPEGMTWEQVYKFGKRQSLEGLLWAAVSKIEATLSNNSSSEGSNTSLLPKNLRIQWEADALNTAYRRIRFDVEREEIYADMRAAGLAYLPLKGILLSDYYPDPSMRSMADNDILYGFVEQTPEAERNIWGDWRPRGITTLKPAEITDAACNTLEPIMAAHGYSTEELRQGKHDTFHKLPIFNFEMHRRLVNEGDNQYEYFKNPWSKAIPVLNNNSNLTSDSVNEESVNKSEGIGEFRLTAEDEYLYFLTHAWGHYDYGGVGLRVLCDELMLLKAKSANFNHASLLNALQKTKLEDFEQLLRGIATKLFDNDSNTSMTNKINNLIESEYQFINNMFKGRAHGSMSANIQEGILASKEAGKSLKAAKLKFVMRKIFLTPEELKAKNEIYSRYPVLIIFSPMARVTYFTKLAFKKSPMLQNAIKTLLNTK